MSNTTRDVRRSRTILTALAVGLLAAALVSGSALAGKPSGGGGGKGGGKPGGGSTLTAQVVVTPNPVPAYSEFRITGCGYPANAGVQFTLYATGVTAVWGGIVDATGCLYNATGWANAPGGATLDVLLNSVSRVASVTFTIE